jgi:hypothetical protein
MVSKAPYMRTRRLLIAAVIVSGILAGGVFDRAIIGAPAWYLLGPAAWAQYSQYADLGAGLLMYPVEGVGAALLLVAATISYHFDRRASTAFPSYLATVMSILGLVFTMKAAPIMLGLGAPQSPEELRKALGGFFFWGLYLRGLADGLAFINAVWALTVVSHADRMSN